MSCRDKLKIAACDRSIYAVIDALMLFAVIGACGFLFYPLAERTQGFARKVLDEMSERVSECPVLFCCLIVALSLLISSLVGFLCYMGNRCGKKGCRGLRDSPEFDIWIDAEENGKKSFVAATKRGIDEYGQVDFELRKAIPSNGKAILVFRSRCGCPVGKLEFAGEQRRRRTRM